MPNQQQIQNTILSASYVLMTKVNNNLTLINSGDTITNYPFIRYLRLNIEALTYQYSFADYTSNNTLILYDRLNQLIGFDTTINSLDPNAQIEGITIQIVNPAGYIAPIPQIPWSSFDPATQNADGNRYIYYNTNWAGYNPVLSLISPAETALIVGVDYTLIPSGGIILLNDFSGAGSPGISDGQNLRAVSYALA